MDRFIDELINRLEKEREEKITMPVRWTYCRAIEIIKQLAEEYINTSTEYINCSTNGWISCSERLPDKNMWCLATFESGGIDKIQYLITNKWGWNGEFADNRVIAWQPLPKPYKTDC